MSRSTESRSKAPSAKTQGQVAIDAKLFNALTLCAVQALKSGHQLEGKVGKPVVLDAEATFEVLSAVTLKTRHFSGMLLIGFDQDVLAALKVDAKSDSATIAESITRQSFESAKSELQNAGITLENHQPKSFPKNKTKLQSVTQGRVISTPIAFPQGSISIMISIL